MISGIEPPSLSDPARATAFPAVSRNSGLPENERQDRVALPRQILLGLSLFALLGAGFACWLTVVPAGHEDPRFWFNVFYVLFARHEPIGLGLVALFSIFCFWLCFRRETDNR